MRSIRNVTIAGCDVFVDPEFIDPSLSVLEDTLYNALEKMDDNSIDVFYWNDVVEHIPNDEIDGYLKLIRVKLSYGGVIITVTPNGLTGPHDITMKFEPKGTKAKDFHLHEYTFHELMKLYRKYNFIPDIGVWRLRNQEKYQLLPTGKFSLIKSLIEYIASVSPYPSKLKTLGIIASNASIVKKI